MISVQKVIKLKAQQTLHASKLTALGYNAIELNQITGSDNQYTLVGLNGTGKMRWSLKDKVIPLNGNEKYTATEDIVIVAGYKQDSILGFVNGTAHGIIDDGEGDLLSKDVDTTQYSIRSFEYYFEGGRYTQDGIDGETVSFAENEFVKIIMVNPTNGIYTLDANEFPDATDLDSGIEIGALTTVDQVNINKVGTSTFYVNNVFKNIYIDNKIFIGTRFLSDAAKVSENATTALTLDIAGGSIVDPNLNIKTITTEESVGIQAIYNVSGVTTVQPEVDPYTINVTQYDDGTDLTTLTSNQFTSHTILRSSRTGQVYLIFGQNQYGTAELAKAEEPNTSFFPSGSEVEAIAQVIVEKNATSISTIIDLRNS